MEELHKAVFKGCINKVRYKLESNGYWDVYPYHYKREHYIKKYLDFDYEEIAECEFDRPPLKEGEKIHIHDLDEIVTVTEPIRSTNGGYIYHTNYVIKTIEDDETIKTKEESERLLKEINRKKENDNQLNLEDSKKWYQFWK